jgi:cytochrome c-type biogenesis protein CcmH
LAKRIEGTISKQVFLCNSFPLFWINMMSFHWWFLALALLAGLFVAWPLLARKRMASVGNELAERIKLNDALYAEQLQDLDQQLQAGEIDQPRYDKLKKELDNQHQQDNAIDAASRSRTQLRHAPWLMAGLAVALPVIAFFLYNNLGAAADWEIQQLNNTLIRQQQSGADPELQQALNQDLFQKLEARLKEKPDNLNNRFLLARTAVELGRLPKALDAYRYILERQPDSPQVLGEMAQVLFLSAGNRFTPEVRQVFDRALAMDPNNSDLLGFAGIAAYQSGQYQLAIDYWQKGRATLNPSDPRYQTWQRAVAEAKRQLEDAAGRADRVANSRGDSATTETTPRLSDSVTSKEASEATIGSLQVSVRLGEHVNAKPGDSVFIYARAWQGSKMPLAMQQVRVADLPLTLELSESMSMMPGMTMSRFPQLEVVARIAYSGTAVVRSGDWQATAGPIDTKTSGQEVKLVIDSQIP